MSSNEAAHHPPNYFKTCSCILVLKQTYSNSFHPRGHMLLTVVFPNFYIFPLNSAADLGVDVYSSFWKGTGRLQYNGETI